MLEIEGKKKSALEALETLEAKHHRRSALRTN
jgi:hypothetical protein